MDPGDSKNVQWNPGLFHPNYILNTLAQPCTFNVKLGWDNLGFPYTFLESPGSIEYCYVFGFLGPRQSLPWLRLKSYVADLFQSHAPRTKRYPVYSYDLGQPEVQLKTFPFCSLIRGKKSRALCESMHTWRRLTDHLKLSTVLGETETQLSVVHFPLNSQHGNWGSRFVWQKLNSRAVIFVYKMSPRPCVGWHSISVLLVNYPAL